MVLADPTCNTSTCVTLHVAAVTVFLAASVASTALRWCAWEPYVREHESA